jgi:prepilin-type N-terminal cleavage/methylation domain-containing protein
LFAEAMRYNNLMSIQNLKSRKSLFGPRATRGFTLLEMAMVLAIIGLIMGTILSMTKTLSSSSKIAATQSKEALIKAALINFIAVNNRLPCPADPTATASTAGTLSTPAGTYGMETVTAATPKGCAMPLSAGVYAGVVPWATLGLTQDAAIDGYNQFFTYLVAATAIKTVPVTAVTALNAGLVPTISGLEGAISIYASQTNLTIPTNNCMPTSYTSTAPYNQCSAVVVIISHGADGLGAYTTSGAAATPLSNAPDENQNALHTNQIVMHDASMTTNNPFDDIILPITSSDLLSPLMGNGTLQPYNAVLNNDFANITAAITNSLIAYKSGGPSPYSYTVLTTSTTPSITAVLASLPQSITYDPWGNQIMYATAITGSISCVLANYSTAIYTLTSKGPDGVTNGLPPAGDDISVTVYFNQLVPAFNVTGC